MSAVESIFVQGIMCRTFQPSKLEWNLKRKHDISKSDNVKNTNVLAKFC